MRNERKGTRYARSLEQIRERRGASGTKYQAKGHTSPPVTTECTHFERPSSFSFHNGGSIEVDLTISLTPTAGGIMLRSRFDAKAHRFFPLIFPIFLIIIRRQEKANIANVKRFLEAAPSQWPRWSRSPSLP